MFTKKEAIQIGVSFAAAACLVSGVLYSQPKRSVAAEPKNGEQTAEPFAPSR